MIGQRLTEIFDIEDIVQEHLNLIVAPCGSGKTFLAKTQLKELTEGWGKMLYLIDTKTGKEQLLHSGTEKENFWTGETYWQLDGITVMTYAGYAYMCKNFPEHDYWKENAVILCDELQNCIQWSKWTKRNGEEKNLHQFAVDVIGTRAVIGNNTVIAISATPEKIREEFSYCLHEVPLYGEPLQYETKKTESYYNLKQLLNSITVGSKGIVYVEHITEMQKYIQLLNEKGHKAEGFWSPNNKEHDMTKEQKQLREYIIEHQAMPDTVDVLFINKSCETSINIHSHIDFMVIHDSGEETQTQVRGRCRNDLERLYLYDFYAKQRMVVDAKWLNKPLTKADKAALCAELDIKNECGRVLGWTTVKEILSDCGYAIEEKRTKKERFTIING